ncbi:MAG: fimbria/pilus periplasmic chaperone [Aestuariivirga sp.]
MATTFAALAIASPAFAGSMQVSPIGIELGQGISTSTENLENKGTTVITAQVRIFKWDQKDGKETLTPTTDVVASPPALKIQPGGKATVRIVRLSKAPIVGEESYRLIIDDIPPPPDKAGDSVTFAVRHAIPVFFQAPGIKTQLSWSASIHGEDLELSASNAGDLHARLAQLVITTAGRQVAALNGLAGYVIGHDASHWMFKVKGVHVGSTLALKAAGNDGPIDTTIVVK